MNNFKKFEWFHSDSLARRRLSDTLSFLLTFKSRLPDSPSHRLPDSPSRRVADSPTHRVRVADSLTRRVGESFVDYEYLREFADKIGTARKVA